MTSKEEIIGTVDAVNREKGKEGLKIKETGKWYNASKRVADYWGASPNAIPKSGTKVKMELVEGKLDFVRRYQEGEDATFKPASSLPRQERGTPDIMPAPMGKEAVPASVWELKDWSAMRGGLSHDAACIVAANIQVGKTPINIKTAGEQINELTELLIQAAEKAKDKKRNEI